MNQKDLTEYIEKSRKTNKELGKLLVSNDWEFERILDCVNGLFDRCPFKKGDKVKLVKTPEINKDTAPSWVWAKHFLTKGSKATIAEIEFYKGKFRFGLIFDKESFWSDDKLIMVKDKGMFFFAEDYVTGVKK